MSELFNEDGLIESSDYAAVMNKCVIPKLDHCRLDSTIPGKDQFSLFCSVFQAENPCGTVLVLHGFTENTDPFAPVCHK